jgi:hypothetical protein
MKKTVFIFSFLLLAQIMAFMPKDLFIDVFQANEGKKVVGEKIVLEYFSCKEEKVFTKNEIEEFLAGRNNVVTKWFDATVIKLTTNNCK